MKILITGGCGFVGSNIAIFLKKKTKKLKNLQFGQFVQGRIKAKCLKIKKSWY